jgi:DNA-binding CsgD family transcriptional regulator
LFRASLRTVCGVSVGECGGAASRARRDLDDGAAAARRRGGLAAVAAFRTRAALLTPGKKGQIGRLVTAAEATHDAGALEAALDLLEMVDESATDDREADRMARLRRQIAFVQPDTANGAPDRPIPAATSAGYDPPEGFEACLRVLADALRTSDGGVSPALAEATSPIGLHDAVAGAADSSGSTGDSLTLVMNGLSILAKTKGTAMVPMLRQMADLVLADAESEAVYPTLPMLRTILILPIALWDEDAWLRFVDHVAGNARRNGALAVLSGALDVLLLRLIWAGDLPSSQAVVEQATWLRAATTGGGSPYLRMILVAWQGEETETIQLVDEIRANSSAGGGDLSAFADYAEAVLYNGTGRFEQARTAAVRLFGTARPEMRTLIASELADAASRSGATEELRDLHAWLRVCVRVTPGPWVVGLAERVTALLSSDEEAEAHYLGSIEQLSRTGSRTELARSELMYGEWLRRQGRRGRARQVLHDAHRRFREAGARAFAERAVRELRAAGERSVSDVDGGSSLLSAQEEHIARLAGEGLTNTEIAARLYISSRTVQYHLRSVFQKLGITSRAQLPSAPQRVLTDRRQHRWTGADR